MYPEQNNAGLLQRRPALNDRPEILVECEHDSPFGFRQVQKGEVACSGEVRAGPNNVVAIDAKGLYACPRKVLVGEDAHSRRNWECLVFVSEVARIR
jgi:hypothetical protein